MISKEEEIQIAVNKIGKFIYGMYIRDLKNTANKGKKIKRSNYDNNTLFN